MTTTTNQSTVTTDLSGTRLLVVGGTSGIALEITREAQAAGAEVILAGRDRDRTQRAADAAGATPTVASVDLGDEESVRALAHDVGRVDGVVSLAANHANGPVSELDPTDIHAAFDAKVIGPILLAKHLDVAEHGVFVLFSGVAAWQPAPGLSVMAATNGAVSVLADALAVELAPRRVVAVSPGIVDSGAWDGDGKDEFFHSTAEQLPARRIGRPADVAAAVLLALTNPFITGSTLHVDGGGRQAR